MHDHDPLELERGGWIAPGGPPWDDHLLSDERLVPLGPDAAAVVYRARGRRGSVHYEARCASTYVRIDGRWRLRMHQQTP